MLANARPKDDRPVHRTLTARPLAGGGWRVTDSAGLVGGLFRDRRAALRALVRERWAARAVVEVMAEAAD